MNFAICIGLIDCIQDIISIIQNGDNSTFSVTTGTIYLSSMYDNQISLSLIMFDNGYNTIRGRKENDKPSLVR